MVLVLVLLVGAGSGARTGTAEAFIGESAVINPTTPPKLTGPAKTILTNPTFLPGTVTEAGTAAGVAESSTAAGVFQAAKLIPPLSALAAFGVGVGVGSEVCSMLGIEGCWFHGSDAAADPAIGDGEWRYNSTGVGPLPMWTYYWKKGGSAYWIGAIIGVNGATESCAVPPPGGVTDYYVGETISCGAGKTTTRSTPLRQSMTNRVLEYKPTDSPSIPNYSYTPPAQWDQYLAEELKGKEGAVGRVGQRIASKIAGSGVKNPYGPYVNIPSCDELTWGACKAVLEEKGLEPIREDLDWSEVTTDVPDQVQELNPAEATEVELPAKVTVATNPDESGMPIVIPDPDPGETYSHYAARLNPSLTPERHDLKAAFIDPDAGPNGVVSTSPKPETRLDPTTTHKVEISTNPADAPGPRAGWTPPELTGIDMGPISGVPSPCTVFPFGLFCWMGEAFAQFNTTGTCPGFDAPIAGTGSDFSVTLCGETSETIMGYLRPALLLAFIVGCGVMFARGTKAVGGD